MKLKASKVGRVFLYTVGTIIVLLIAVRAILPVVIKNQINNTLETSLTDYTGSIEDFDLALWRGTYFVQGLKLKKRTATANDYIVQIRNIEVDLSWEALFKKQILLDVLLAEPIITLYDAEKKEKKQNGTEEKNWMEALQSIIPFKLQSFQVEDGQIVFKKVDSDPAVSIELEQINLNLNNIGNIDDELKDEKLPSDFSLNARFQKEASLSSSGRVKLIGGPIAADLDADLTSFSIPKLNDFFKAYGFFDVTKGELATKLKLRAKWPNLNIVLGVKGKDLDVVAPAQKFLGFRGVVTEMALALVNLIARDPKNLTLSTQIKIEGNYPDLKVNTWEAVKDLFDDRK